MNFQVTNPNYKAIIEDVFASAPFIQSLGVELIDLGAGWVETGLLIRPNHNQQNGFVHAGVQSTIADHSAGSAALTLAKAGKAVLTIEFKVNLLRPAKGERLTCRSEVLKPGKTITVAESMVWAWQGDTQKLVSKATVTLALVDEQ